MTFLRIHRQEGYIFGRIGESVKKLTNLFSNRHFRLETVFNILSGKIERVRVY